MYVYAVLRLNPMLQEMSKFRPVVDSVQAAVADLLTGLADGSIVKRHEADVFQIVHLGSSLNDPPELFRVMWKGPVPGYSEWLGDHCRLFRSLGAARHATRIIQESQPQRTPVVIDAGHFDLERDEFVFVGGATPVYAEDRDGLVWSLGSAMV